MASKTYDFIIVGGGTAGCLLAHRLAHAPARPSVLLVEAGGNPTGEELQAPFYRYMAPALRPDLDYAYETVPQKQLNNRVIPYSRGKGLGGTSVLNFQVYLYGSDEDYNRWAELVGDETWNWEHTKRSFQQIEDYEFEGSKAYSHLAKPDARIHGKGGTVKVRLPPVLERGIEPVIEAVAKTSGDKINLDFNSGDPIGIGIFPSSTSKDGRTTSASAHLVDAPSNLEIWTNAVVHKLLFNGTRVVGIETADGRNAHTSKEVVICNGAIDSPRLLLLNGIGPAKELEALNIKVVTDLPGVGKHLLDHVMTFISVETDAAQNDRWAFQSNEKMITEARALWQKDRSGNFALHNGVLWGGFLKLPGHEQFPEYQALDRDLQEFLSKTTVPSYEFVGSALLWPPDTVLPEDSSYITAIAFLMNPVSEGSITLRSSDPNEKPLIDMAYLTHPHDWRVMREAIRETSKKLFETPEVKKHVKRQIFGPASLSDTDIDHFIREAATTVWHANGSVKMGKADDPMACVDSSLRVRGVEGLRVADVSVCPLTMNNHTQPTAYLVGQKAADTLFGEYNLGTTKSKV
ncbi:choline dehydrogenase [Byssothecium circinans]|uniref:Choline dehydrogenase n=1 Tax=Byssothecium circinans TaxID=147558 RepID=A0A6A5TS67_9PLEO|nr:choline dehydrogenase [Byssothecium circinans]